LPARPRNTGDDAAAGRGAHNPARTALIEFHGVGHTYRSLVGRTVRAVDDFSLAISESEVFGLAGPNGAGKSTLIALLLGYLEPTDGTVRIDGLRPREFVERSGIGYLSELIAIPARWKLEEALQRYAILAGVPRDQLPASIARVTELLGLEEHRGKRIKQLSKGNLQRLGLAQALLRDERVIILDEPTHGLDPVWTQRFRDVVDALRRPGRVIFSAWPIGSRSSTMGSCNGWSSHAGFRAPPARRTCLPPSVTPRSFVRCSRARG
jgi:ABC-2 type transport system ATP-binding protein